jgi:hypothetical protein
LETDFFGWSLLIFTFLSDDKSNNKKILAIW